VSHKKGLGCPFEDCRKTFHLQHNFDDHQHWHKTGDFWRCRLGCKDLWFRSRDVRHRHHVTRHGTSFTAVCKAAGKAPALYGGDFDIPLLAEPQAYTVPEYNRAGVRRVCSNCADATLQACWEKDGKGGYMCRTCYRYQAKRGKARDPTPRPSRCRACCDNCGRRPSAGRTFDAFRGPNDEVLCRTCYSHYGQRPDQPPLPSISCGHCGALKAPSWRQMSDGSG